MLQKLISVFQPGADYECKPAPMLCDGAGGGFVADVAPGVDGVGDDFDAKMRHARLNLYKGEPQELCSTMRVCIPKNLRNFLSFCF